MSIYNISQQANNGVRIASSQPAILTTNRISPNSMMIQFNKTIYAKMPLYNSQFSLRYTDYPINFEHHSYLFGFSSQNNSFSLSFPPQFINY